MVEKDVKNPIFTTYIITYREKNVNRKVAGMTNKVRAFPLPGLKIYRFLLIFFWG